MKRSITKFLSIMVCMAVILIAAPVANMQSIQAAPKAQGTVDLKAKKLIIPKGKTQKIKNKTVTMVKARRYQVKVIDTTAHKHSWKTLTKATCASKGKKLCKICGATGTTAMSKTHSFKITKKATCETKGVKTCTVCGTKEAIAKTAHEYVTETATYIEGRGTPHYVNAKYCNGCGIDITDWPVDKASAHWTDIEGMQAGTVNWDCFSAGYNALGGIERYPKYVKTKTVETYCKHCGAWKDKTNEDLYEVYYDEWRNVVRKSDGKILEETPAYKAAKPYLEKAKELEESKNQGGTATASVRKAAARAVASPQDVITDIPDNAAVEDANMAISADETVSTDAAVEGIISGNAVSENTSSELNNNIPLD